MTKYERWNALLELLADAGRLEVETAAAQLRVSTATIRRDLDELAGQQMLTRTRGGAVAHSVSYDLPLRYKSARHAPEKQRIARAAATMAAPGAVVGLNGGTTTTEVARAIAGRADLNGAGGVAVTIVTNALNIASELAIRPQVKIVVVGGVARPQSYELIGPMAAAALEEMSLDIAILGVDGIDVDNGASAHDEGEAHINRVLASRAREVVVAADASKIGGRAFSRICPIDAVHTLVTDDAVDDAAVARFVEAGVSVTRV